MIKPRIAEHRNGRAHQMHVMDLRQALSFSSVEVDDQLNPGWSGRGRVKKADAPRLDLAFYGTGALRKEVVVFTPENCPVIGYQTCADGNQ